MLLDFNFIPNEAKAKKMYKHRRDHSICCRPEVAGGIVLGCDVKAVEGHVVANFEVASCSIFGDYAEFVGGARGINAISSR